MLVIVTHFGLQYSLEFHVRKMIQRDYHNMITNTKGVVYG